MPVACRWCIILRTGFERWNLSREWGVTPSCDGHNGKSKWESGTWNDGYWKTSVRRAATHMIGIATLTWHPATMKGWNSAWISARRCGCSVLMLSDWLLSYPLSGSFGCGSGCRGFATSRSRFGSHIWESGKSRESTTWKAESFRHPHQKMWMGVWIDPHEVWLSTAESVNALSHLPESVNQLWMVESIWQVPDQAGVNAPPPFTELSLRTQMAGSDLSQNS